VHRTCRGDVCTNIAVIMRHGAIPVASGKYTAAPRIIFLLRTFNA
jgi:hypothetical protein